MVAAEELAPYLDPHPPSAGGGGGDLQADAASLRPALARLGGEPLVDEGGHVLYRFRDLQEASAVQQVGRPTSARRTGVYRTGGGSAVQQVGRPASARRTVSEGLPLLFLAVLGGGRAAPSPRECSSCRGTGFHILCTLLIDDGIQVDEMSSALP